jgi:hypothetical protein
LIDYFCQGFCFWSRGGGFKKGSLRDANSMAKIKIYLDNCTYNRPFDDQTQIRISLETDAKRHIQRLIVENNLDLVYSYVSRLENDDNPFAALFIF